MSNSETKFWFGKHEGKELSETPAGYLRWMVENIDPKPLDRDTRGMSEEEIAAMEDRMRNFISAAEDDLAAREEKDGS